MTALTSPPDAGPQRPAAPSAWHAPALDGVRAIAAVLVLLTHVGFLAGINGGGGFAGVGALFSRFDIGVPIFFVLSGLLLYRPYVAAVMGHSAGPRPVAYLVRRAARILPAYWVVTTTALLALNREYLRDPYDWLNPLLLLQVYEELRIPRGMEQSWSLAVEVAFYLALPLIAWLLGRLTGGRSPRVVAALQLALLAVLAAAGLAWQVWAHAAGTALPSVAGLWLPGYLDWFAAGMALAVLSAWADAEPPSVARRLLDVAAAAPGACWTAALAIFCVAVTPVAGPKLPSPLPTPFESVGKHVLYGLAATLFVLPCVTRRPGPLVGALLANRAARYLGRISYGIFLWHLLVLTLYRDWSDRAVFTGGFWPSLGVTVSVTLLLASASWHLLEQPVLRLTQRSATASPPPPPRPTPSTTAGAS